MLHQEVGTDARGRRVSKEVHSQRFGYLRRYADLESLANIVAAVKADLATHRAPDQRLLDCAEGRLYSGVAEPALLGSI
jgi:hypothetical protein